MRLLEERIKEDGQVRPGNILKVDSFLNHQLDVSLLEQLGKEFFERFKDKGITRILTIEASGIALACLAAQYFKVPVDFPGSPMYGHRHDVHRSPSGRGTGSNE